MITDATVRLWGTDIGAVSWLADREIGVFQYMPEFLPSGIEVAPLTMPLNPSPIEFGALPRNTFRGLPGLLADSLPDDFGNALIDAWLAAEGRTGASFSPVERLCYVGRRGMGALEFEPVIPGPRTEAREIELERLLELAQRVMQERGRLRGAFSGVDDREAIETILQIGTSAGGARAKAILAWNPETGEFRSGQLSASEGFEYWLMKFDGVDGEQVSTPLGYGRIEYAYHLMARAAGIVMADCRLHHEGGRSHFMTRRFDRSPEGDKVHMQSLGAIAHYDFRQPGAYSYEQALHVCRRLGLPAEDLEQQVLRAFFNVIARNCDDHVKNIALLMDRRGTWRLSPAFDVAFAHNPKGTWTSRHQMSIGGKRDGHTREDLLDLAGAAGIKRSRARGLLAQVVETVERWPEFAGEAGVPGEQVARIPSAYPAIR